MQRVHQGGGSRPWMRGWMRGVTLKECQSDSQRVLFPPLLVTLWIALAAKALGVLEGTMMQRDPSRLLRQIMTVPKNDNNNKQLLVEP